MCYSFRVYIPAPEMIEHAPGLRLNAGVCQHDGQFSQPVMLLFAADG